ncbi:MAG: hydrogenase maturation nickel metallochaperone HypA [Candidatus Lindowbacteria bacterium]|nr:hydrogenase maturation nickel metallochaperone HypA [Candidatus Lindowbacteria bacterium]
MHELPVVGELLKIALKVQRYFEFLARETIARNAQLLIERAPITLLCDKCDKQFMADKKDLDFACPDCRDKRTTLVRGKEFTVKSIEIQ